MFDACGLFYDSQTLQFFWKDCRLGLSSILSNNFFHSSNWRRPEDVKMV